VAIQTVMASLLQRRAYEKIDQYQFDQAQKEEQEEQATWERQLLQRVLRVVPSAVDGISQCGSSVSALYAACECAGVICATGAAIE
jgi:hypothetical protein